MCLPLLVVVILTGQAFTCTREGHQINPYLEKLPFKIPILLTWPDILSSLQAHQGRRLLRARNRGGGRGLGRRRRINDDVVCAHMKRVSTSRSNSSQLARAAYSPAASAPLNSAPPSSASPTSARGSVSPRSTGNHHPKKDVEEAERQQGARRQQPGGGRSGKCPPFREHDGNEDLLIERVKQQIHKRRYHRLDDDERLEYGWAGVVGWALAAVLVAAAATWAGFACAYAGEASSRERACHRLLIEAQTEAIRCHDAAVLRVVSSASRAALGSDSADGLRTEASGAAACHCASSGADASASLGVASSSPHEDPSVQLQYPWWPPEEQPHVTTAISTDDVTALVPTVPLGDAADQALPAGGPDPGFRPMWMGSLGMTGSP